MEREPISRMERESISRLEREPISRMEREPISRLERESINQMEREPHVQFPLQASSYSRPNSSSTKKKGCFNCYVPTSAHDPRFVGHARAFDGT